MKDPHRTTYGYISFKIPCTGLKDDEIVAAHTKIVKDMAAVLKAAGGELVTLEEVAKANNVSDEDMLGKSAVVDIVDKD